MNKSRLVIGILVTLGGLIFLAAALTSGMAVNPYFYGFAGGFIGSGVVMIGNYTYWTLPTNKEKLAERREEYEINLHDERKERLRDKSGRYAYILGIMVISISIVLLTVFAELQILVISSFVIWYLGAYLLLQGVAGVVIFRYLNRKY